MKSQAASLREVQRENGRLQEEVDRLQQALTLARQPEEPWSFFNGTADLVTIVDADGRLSYVNPSCELAFGLPTEQLIGMLAFEFVHPDDREATQQALAECVKQRARSMSIENRQISQGGLVRVFLWTIMPRYSEGGDVLSVWSIARDITELRETEHRLRESARRYRILAESTPDMVFVVEQVGTVSYMNRAATAACGADSESFAGKPLAEVFPTRVAQFLQHGLAEVFATGLPFSDVRSLTLDGAERDLDLALVPTVDVEAATKAVMGVLRDVTERVALQRHLREALEDLRVETRLTDTIIDSMPGVICVLDFDGGLLRWNESLEHVTGLSGEEIAATNALALFEGEDQQRIAAAIQETARVGEVTVEAEILHKSGRKTPYLFTGRKTEIRSKDHWVGIGVDLTARLRQERVLSERVKELRCLYQVSAACSSGVSVPALLNEIVALVPSGWQFPQATQARIEFDEVGYGEDLQEASLRTSHVLSAELTTNEQPRGRVLVCRSDVAAEGPQDPFLDEERDLLAAIARIISEAIERRESTTQFKRVLERAPIPLCLVDEREELVFPNARFYETFGYTAEELPTLTEWWRFAYPDEDYRRWVLETWNEAVQRAVARGVDIEPVEYRITCKDGSVKLMEISGVVIGESFLATFVDVTARREAEDVLRNHRDQLETEVRQRTEALRARSRELEVSNRELNAFAYSVSHDLRAPLRSITGFTHALLEDYHDQLDADGKDYLERCSAAARRMGQLIDDLLTLSRVTRSEMRPSAVDFSELAHGVVRELRAEQSDWGGDIVVEGDLHVCADRRLLQHAVRNLLHNAMKFSAKTAQPSVVVGSSEHDGEMALHVRDNGAGFDMAYADSLFTPFHRLHKESEFAGTGIGLSIVQRIVRMHGGRIWAESAPGQGATFYFTLAIGAAPDSTEEDS